MVSLLFPGSTCTEIGMYVSTSNGGRCDSSLLVYSVRAISLQHLFFLYTIVLVSLRLFGGRGPEQKVFPCRTLTVRNSRNPRQSFSDTRYHASWSRKASFRVVDSWSRKTERVAYRFWGIRRCRQRTRLNGDGTGTVSACHCFVMPQ